MNNPMQMFNEFMRFKNSFRGDPQQKVQELINSGQISQQKLNELQGMARQFQQTLSQFGFKI